MTMDFWRPSEETEQRLLSAGKFTMSDRKPEVTLLTLEHLTYAMFVFIADKVKKTRTCREHETEYFVAHQILRFFLGDQWTEKSIFDQTPGTTHYYRQGRRFLKTDSPGVDENVKHQDRIIKLAECLYNLQHIPGIAERIASLQQDGLESAYTELECARIMSHPSLQLRFIAPRGGKQDDYDAEIITSTHRTICCEIKAKEDTSDLTRKRIENSIETARKQLPKCKPGIVWIKIPEQWASQNGSRGIVDEAVRRALRNSNRIVAIMVAFQLWESDGDGMLTQFRFTVTVNKASKYYGDDISDLVKTLGIVQNGEWSPLRDLITSRFADCVSFVESKLASEGEDPASRNANASRSVSVKN
jgi:hypothetical protein